MTHRAPIAFVLPLLLAVTSAAPAVSAQPAAASQADRDRARELALQGINAFNRNDFTTAIERFQAAEQAFHAPVHLRFLALAFERATPARLLEARETWRRLSREQLPADAPQPFRDAVAEGARELPRIEGLLGRVQFQITNGGPGMVVEIDGRGLSVDALAEPQFAPAGEHLITARRAGFTDVQRTVRVTAGATESVAFSFEAPRPTVTVEAPPPVMTRTVVHPSPMRTVGFALAGVGGAALIGGIITGVMASGAYSDLETRCPGGVCSNQADLNRRSDVDTLAGATNGLLIGGGVLAVAGVVMILVGRPRTETVQVTAGLRGGSLSIAF